jgi:hypothetical protein
MLNHSRRVITNREPWLWLTTALISVGPEMAGTVIGKALLLSHREGDLHHL